MKKLFLCLLVAFMAIMPFGVKAQIVDPVKWAFSIENVNETEFDLVATATVDPEYHIYSTSMPDMGPMPTVFEIEPNEFYELVGTGRDVTPGQNYYDDIFEVEYVQFSGTATYAQRLKKLTDQPFTVVGDISYQACKEGGCVSLVEDFKVKVAGANGEMPADIEEIAETETDNQEDNQVIKAGGDDYEYFTSEGAESTDTSLWGMILAAILWGFAALLTPCVFPMVPMTVSFFMHGEGESKKEGRFKALMYFLFIVLLYTLPIAILILVTYFIGGEGVTTGIFNWLATNWIPNLIFFIVFMVFAASFFGAFEITFGQRYVE